MVAQNILDWFDINKIEEKYKQANKKALEARQEWEEKHPIISGIQKDYQPGYRAAVPKWEQAAKYGMNAPLIEQAKTGLKEIGLNLVPSVNIAVDAATGGSGTLTKQAVKQAVAKPLVRNVGKQIAKNTAEGLIKGAEAGAIGGATQGVTSSLADNGISKDLLSRPLLYGGMGLLTGGAFGGLSGFGAGQFGKYMAKKNLLDNPEAQMNFARDYLEGLNDKVLTKQGFTLGDIRGLKTGEYGKLGSGRDVLNDILMDDTGNPISFYHSTPKSGFTEFKPGSYFTKDAEYSKGYMEPNASALGFKKVTDTDVPGMYEVNLDFNNTFDTRNPVARDIFNKEYQAYYSPELSERGLPDWMEAEDLMEWLQNKHPEYDSLIVDEGGTGGGAFNQPLRLRGESYLPFKPEQVKIKKLYDKDGNIIKNFEEEAPKNLKSRDEWVKIDGKDYHILNLPKKDYGKIMHIIDTYIKPDDMIGEVITRNDDMYKYTFQKISPTDYKFIKRRKLK